MQNLFKDFQATSASDWKNQIIKDLKGENYENLRWFNENGFYIEPFYTAENLKHEYKPAFTHKDWNIGIELFDSKTANAEILKALNYGANAIHVHCTEGNPDGLLKDIKLNAIHSTFQIGNIDYLLRLADYLQKNYNIHDLQMAIVNHYVHGDQYNKWLAKVMALPYFTKAKTIQVSVTLAHDLNCFAYYEIALALVKLVDIIELRGNKSLPETDFIVSMGVSTDYFTEIAKFRALRRLWQLIKEDYLIANDLYIVASGGPNNKTISDRHNNLLRTTVEAMAAITGGCNELILPGFEPEQLFQKTSEIADRLAINQQHILKYESYFDKIADVGCGSYYIETLTDQLAERALTEFKKIIKREYIDPTDIAEDIWLQGQKRMIAFQEGKTTIVGVNKFQNETEKIKLSKSYLQSLRDSCELRTGDFENHGLIYELDNLILRHGKKL